MLHVLQLGREMMHSCGRASCLVVHYCAQTVQNLESARDVFCLAYALSAYESHTSVGLWLVDVQKGKGITALIFRATRTRSGSATEQIPRPGEGGYR